MAGCNSLLGIRPALDDEWDGGTLADGAPVVSPITTGASTSTSSASSSSALPDAGPVAHWANWPMPNPPSITPPLVNPQSYDASSAGVVVDQVTHLTWEANPSATLFSYADAVAHCAGLQLGGSGGAWRLPSRVELVSIVDNTMQPRIAHAFAMPAVDGGTSLTFWASSLLAADSSHAWIVDFGTTTNLVIPAQAEPSSAMPVVVTYFARCVRGP